MSAALGDAVVLLLNKHDTASIYLVQGMYSFSKMQSDQEKIKMVAAGNEHMALVTEYGDLYMFGTGKHGRLGLGNEENQKMPLMVQRELFSGEFCRMVACGKEHTVVLTKKGKVYTFGSGLHGELGYKNETNRQLIPKKVESEIIDANFMVMVAAGHGYTVAVSKNGQVFDWGYGVFGKLGQGNVEHKRVPQRIDPELFLNKEVIFVAAGEDHMAAITKKGNLFTWGDGWFGQLGHDNEEKKLVPTMVKDIEKCKMVSCSRMQTVVVTEEKELWVCGSETEDKNEKRNVFQKKWDRATVFACAGEKGLIAVTDNDTFWFLGNNVGQDAIQLDDVRQTLNICNTCLSKTMQSPFIHNWTLSQSHAHGSVTGWESDFRPLDRPVVDGDLFFVNLDIGMDVWDTWNGEEDVSDDEAGYVSPVFRAHSGVVVWAPSNGVMPGGFVDIVWNDCPEPWRSRTFRVDTSMWRFDGGSRYWIWETDYERNFSDTNSEASLVDNSSPPWG